MRTTGWSEIFGENRIVPAREKVPGGRDKAPGWKSATSAPIASRGSSSQKIDLPATMAPPESVKDST